MLQMAQKIHFEMMPRTVRRKSLTIPWVWNSWLHAGKITSAVKLPSSKLEVRLLLCLAMALVAATSTSSSFSAKMYERMVKMTTYPRALMLCCAAQVVE